MISDVKIKNGYLSKNALPLKTVPTQEALAFAVAAQRINNGYVKDTRRFSEDNPTIFSNKEIVKFALRLNEVENAKYLTHKVVLGVTYFIVEMDDNVHYYTVSTSGQDSPFKGIDWSKETCET